MTLSHNTLDDQRKKIEFRIYQWLNRVDYETRISTYAAMYRAAREGGEKAVDAMAQVERELKAGQS